MTRQRVKVFFDGGCRPNPGRMEAAVVVRGIVHLFDDLGHGSSAEAEWLALIRALELAQAHSLTNVELIGDAIGVIRQANLALATGVATYRHAVTVQALADDIRPGRIRWIKRAQNLAGIALAARHPR